MAYTRKSSLAMFTTQERLGIGTVADSYFEWLSMEDRERQEKYRQYRDYYNGIQLTQLTDRQKEYLELNNVQEFVANYCKLVVDEVQRRLNVRGFDAGDQGGTGGPLWSWWQWGRMDANQKDVHSSAIRDGDTFLITEWDSVNNRPRYYHNLAYDGVEGVKVIYDDETREIAYASKKWNVTLRDKEGNPDVRVRINLYYPSYIERWITSRGEGKWEPYTGDGKEAVIPWVDKRGNPLGVPVEHFSYQRNGWRWGMSLLDSVIPMQNALNKSVIDLLAAADLAGFPVYWGAGTQPVDEDGDPVKVSPGMFIAAPDPAARIGRFDAADLRPMIETVDAFKVSIAQISETPLHLFQVSGQNASEGAQKQQEVGMISRAEDAAVHFGNAWENVMYLSRRLHNAFGTGPALNEDQLITTLWKDFEVRDRIERVRTQGEALEKFTMMGGDYEAVARYVGIDEESAAAMARFAAVPLEYEKLNTQEQVANAQPQQPEQE